VYRDLCPLWRHPTAPRPAAVVEKPRRRRESAVDTAKIAKWTRKSAGAVEPNLPLPAKRKNQIPISKRKNQIPISKRKNQIPISSKNQIPISWNQISLSRRSVKTKFLSVPMNTYSRRYFLLLFWACLVGLGLQAQISGLILTNPAPQGNGAFGFQTVALGELLVISHTGASNNAGAVHLFDQRGVLIRTLSNPTPEHGNFFGHALAPIGRDRILGGAPLSAPPPAGQPGAVHLFHTNGTLLRTFFHPRKQKTAIFGAAVAAVGDDQVLIGSTLDNLAGTNAGAAYLYRIDGTLLATFINPEPAGGSDFGFSGFGSALAVLGPDRLLIGAPGDPFRSVAGTAYLFATDGSLLRTFRDPNGLVDSRFGATLVPLGNDRVLIAAPNANIEAPGAGAANIFDTEGRIITPLFNPEPGLNDGFGSPAVAVGDNKVLIGSTERNPELFGFRTQAYLFSTNGVLLMTLSNSQVSISYNNSFASLDADRALVGVPGGDPTGVFPNSGTAYLIELVPMLGVVRTASGPLRIAWPSPWTGWALQRQTTLSPTGWETDSGVSEDDGISKSVLVDPSESGRYFRLFKP